MLLCSLAYTHSASAKLGFDYSDQSSKVSNEEVEEQKICQNFGETNKNDNCSDIINRKLITSLYVDKIKHQSPNLSSHFYCKSTKYPCPGFSEMME